MYYRSIQCYLICIGGGFNISPLKPRHGRPRTQVQHLMQIDLKGWGVNYISYFQQHCLLQMLNSVAGKLQWLFISFLQVHLGSVDGVTAAVTILRVPKFFNWCFSVSFHALSHCSLLWVKMWHNFSCMSTYIWNCTSSDVQIGWHIFLVILLWSQLLWNCIMHSTWQFLVC